MITRLASESAISMFYTFTYRPVTIFTIVNVALKKQHGACSMFHKERMEHAVKTYNVLVMPNKI